MTLSTTSLQVCVCGIGSNVNTVYGACTVGEWFSFEDTN